MGWRRNRIAKSATKWLEPGETSKLVLTGNGDKGGEFAIIATDRNVYESKLPRMTKVEKPRRKTPLADAKVGIDSEGALPELGIGTNRYSGVGDDAQELVKLVRRAARADGHEAQDPIKQRDEWKAKYAREALAIGKVEQPVRYRAGLLRGRVGVLAVGSGKVTLTDPPKRPSGAVSTVFDQPLTSLVRVRTPPWRAGIAVLRFDHGSRHVISFRKPISGQWTKHKYAASPVYVAGADEALGELGLAVDTLSWLDAGLTARSRRREWKALLTGERAPEQVLAERLHAAETAAARGTG